MKNTEKLYELAAAAMQKAYAPYSSFHVGACIETTNGNLHTGCNIENASYGLTLCAEACAIAKMISSGDTEIKQIAIVVNGPGIATPCGACRQRLLEFAKPDIQVHIGNLKDEHVTYRLDELLPLAFSKRDLD